jgi:nucleotide-binding universal stress UspA family protein
MKTTHNELKPVSYKKILVPVDFSDVSRSAALYAIYIAVHLKAEVVLISIVEVMHGNSTIMNLKKLEDQMMRDADEQSSRLTKELKSGNHGVKISSVTIMGTPIEQKVLEYAADSDIDLIVMGTSGASGLKAAILGTNAAALINRSNIPVIAIPGGVKFKSINKIVLATDMVDLDKHAKEIVRFAKVFNSSIDILHVAGTYREQRPVDELQSMLVQMTGYPQLSLKVVLSDDITAAINNYVTEQRADLLVMFTHELGLFEKIFGKGQTRKMAFHTEVPLLAVKRTAEQMNK